ncbi:MAG TPA: PBP1A family penicillin-binding protein [Paucimonas sp.]|nr:PBP1A family penicillin-binding protein [Paucimonas sp.]
MQLPFRRRLALLAAGAALAAASLAALLLAYTLIVVVPNLPPLDSLTDYRPKLPLRVYTADNVLIGEFGAEHRDFVPIKDMPPLMKNALLAIEDSRFYEHGGIDFQSGIRAVLANLLRPRSQGASTITMQVAREFLLTRDKNFGRKLTEIVLTLQIESRLSKDRILELYMNQIYLGERSYGFAGAARTYFGKTLQELTIAETALLAGLPQRPGTANPVVNPERAKQRRQAVLARMHQLGHITAAQYDQARREEIHVRSRRQPFGAHAEHAAEMVRQAIYAQYKDEAYTRGINVYTTLDSREQEAAYRALRRQVIEYESRHGYRGPEARIDLPEGEDERQEAIEDALLDAPDAGDLQPAIVLAATPQAIRAQLLSGEVLELRGDSLRLVAGALRANAGKQLRVQAGSLIRVTREAAAGAPPRWTVVQLPRVEAALVALDARDGAYRALVGGFDFGLRKFNHATQAWRQPGSSIKPFVYSAALEKGFSPATLINDAPLVVGAAETGGKAWEPRNDDGFDGPLTMRTALAKSKNVPSVRILRAVGAAHARDYLARFGFDSGRHPANLTMTLGTGATTPQQLAGAYAVFANGGYRIEPYLIRKITDARGNLLSQAEPKRAGEETERVLDERNAFVIDSMLRDVVGRGTGAAALKLGRGDLAGKTGTTSDAVDGWFAGYAGDVVAVAWMGYDEPRSLGGREFGATLALPIWIDYMRAALAGKQEARRAVPAGLSQVDGDWAYDEFVGEGAVRTVGFDGGETTAVPGMASGAVADDGGTAAGAGH